MTASFRLGFAVSLLAAALSACGSSDAPSSAEASIGGNRSRSANGGATSGGATSGGTAGASAAGASSAAAGAFTGGADSGGAGTVAGCR
ncbi:MAG: hypothetical protein ABW061_26145 [Polyangiaceae bacterium]